ncbi:MAG: hypothetical protein N2Z72_04490 [Bacteroidales bacterium]|nr:hypothetical protein [Bacteroidales bacterium]
MREFISIVLIACVNSFFAQHGGLRDIVVYVDTNSYMYFKDKVKVDGRYVLPVEFRQKEEIVRVEINLTKKGEVSLIYDSIPFSYHVVMPFYEISDGLWVCKLKMRDLVKDNFIVIPILIKFSTHEEITFLELFPVFKNHFSWRSLSNEEVFVGEEIMLELEVPFEGLVLSSNWIDKDGYSYKVSIQQGKTWVQVIPWQAGNRSFDIHLNLYKPFLENGKFRYEFVLPTPQLQVRNSRLAYLSFEQKEFMLDVENIGNPIEILVENHRQLKLQKTYRIENKEDKGLLIAEIYTRKTLANNKVLCEMYLYNHHRQQDGSLYIKDGDLPIFLTNFSVLPKPTIQSIQISSDGKQWKTGNQVYPGEEVIVLLTGRSLDKAQIGIEGLRAGEFTLLSQKEDVVKFMVKIPVDILPSRLYFLFSGKPSGSYIQVVERQKPRSFDFLEIDYGEGFKQLSTLVSPLFCNKNIPNIVIRANPDKIDEPTNLNGKQYIDIELKIIDRRGQTVEILKLPTQCFCPGSSSPRYEHYACQECNVQEISLNQFLQNKTYQLDSWSRILINIRHDASYYSEKGYEKQVELILQQLVHFDIDVSFPAGLLTIEPGTEKIGNLSGISMAMIAQFTFYRKNKVAKALPLKVGMGFLALNAFNFSSNDVNRDMSLVGVFSLYPIRREKLTFPLYFGGGYFLSQTRFFWLLGPGIQVRF